MTGKFGGGVNKEAVRTMVQMKREQQRPVAWYCPSRQEVYGVDLDLDGVDGYCDCPVAAHKPVHSIRI